MPFSWGIYSAREIPGGFQNQHAPDFRCPTARKMALVPFFSYLQLETSSRDTRTSALTSLVSSRSCARWPPVQALRPTRCLPSGDLGPVDLAHGFHCLINSACRALRSGVQVVAMICLQ
jgi:hypothetical protein